VSVRVDEVPWGWRPLHLAWAWLTALALFAYLLAVRWTSRIETRGEEGESGRIYCHWHRSIGIDFVAVRWRGRHAWMQHPAWYMKPIHLLIGWLGVERIVLGSSRHGGRAAADELVALVADGWSTAVFPDGPAGPAFSLHRGVLYMSEQSGAPIVPMRLSASCRLALPTWDGKHLPLPFGTIRVAFGEPLEVRGRDLAEAERLLVEALGGPDEPLPV
jgi:lysophospholipid acyltransferase (LPLAT)-like uncharacterized protein